MPSPPSPVDLSVIVLCYRSEERITAVAESIRSLVSGLTERYELILVGNYIEGSPDRTKEIVETIAAADARCRAICLPKKGMMGWDMKKGLEAARGDYLCVIDGDGQFPVESIARCYEEIRKGDLDLVKTYRFRRGDPFVRRLISILYNLIFALLFPGLGSRDVNSKPKLMTRSAYERMTLASDDWFIDAEIMLNVRKQRMTFMEFPVAFYRLEGRASFVKPPALLEFIWNLIRYKVKGS